MPDLLLGSIWYVVFLLSLTAHEAAHAWAALRGGDPTAYWGGQVTLDPRPHIRREPFGTVVVPLLMFASSGFMMGWASTPYDPRWALAHPRRAGWMSLAGPAANLALVVLAAGAIHLGVAAGVFEAPDSIRFTRVTLAVGGGIWPVVATFASVLFTLNLLLLVFNLIPVPPLDGSGALAVLLSGPAARRVQLLWRRPGISFAGLFAAWMLIDRLFSPMFLVAVNWLYPGVSYR